MRAVLAAARAAIVCAQVVGTTTRATSQQPAQTVPFLTVPSGAPPAAPQPSTISVDDAIRAALQAVGGGGGAESPSAGVSATPPTNPTAPVRANPFAAPPSTPGAANVLLPFNPAQAAENVKVTDDQDGLISLAVREGSLRQVVAMIAETQKLNLVFAGATDTAVTATFDRQPWQTVLDALLSASGHTWTVRGDIVFVASLEVADFMPPDAGGQQVELFELDFASALDVQQTIQGLLSPAGKSWIIESDPKDNRRTREAVAVSDFPAFVARISQYIAQADQPPRQVYIQAHILEVTLNDTCRNGINFENIMRWSSTPVSLKNVGFANPALQNADIASTPTGVSAFLVDVEGDGINGLTGLVELLQTTTDAKTLASPEIHAVSGQFSRMQIGDQLPYRNTATTQTASLESAQFLDVGVVLEVTPRVARDGRILMRIRPEVSTGEYRPEADGLPSKKTTEIETDVLMCSGQAIVIGGLISEEDSNQQAKLPWIGDWPYVGVLFQKRTVVKTRKEIIITLRPFVLPYEPMMQDVQARKIMRAETPLTQGAIDRYPRPYEPRLKDTFDHWNAKHAGYYSDVSGNYPFADGPLLELPPVEEFAGDVVEQMPVDAWSPAGEEIPPGELTIPNGAAPYSELPPGEPALQ
jgi:type II secretory pathway component GspD/PulD (secretin)